MTEKKPIIRDRKKNKVQKSDKWFEQHDRKRGLKRQRTTDLDLLIGLTHAGMDLDFGFAENGYVTLTPKSRKFFKKLTDDIAKIADGMRTKEPEKN